MLLLLSGKLTTPSPTPSRVLLGLGRHADVMYDHLAQ